MEQLLLVTGTEWADAVKRHDHDHNHDSELRNGSVSERVCTQNRDFLDNTGGEMEGEKETWATVVSHKAMKLAASRAQESPKVGEGREFVIPAHEGVSATGSVSGHESRQVRGQGRVRGQGQDRSCGHGTAAPWVFFQRYMGRSFNTNLWLNQFFLLIKESPLVRVRG